MQPIDPESLTFSYSLQYRGIPNADHDPSDYPLQWNVTVTGYDVDGLDDDDYNDDDQERHVANAVAYLIPAAAEIDLLDIIDAVSAELMGVAEHLVHVRPDLLAQLEERPDLLYVSFVEIDEDLRGRDLSYPIMNAIIETIGRSAELTILFPAPILTDTTPEENTPGHKAAVASLHRHWEAMGFYDIGGGYMAFGGIQSLLDALDEDDRPGADIIDWPHDPR